MTDYISKQAAIDALAEEFYYNDEDYRTAVKAIGGLPSAQQWILCSERLPEIGKQVLCCNSQSRVFTSALTEIASNGMMFFGQHCKVIAWMPLPEPYKEGEA